LRAILTTACFPLGTNVQIISTGQWGVVIKTADKKNRVRVAVGAIEMLVEAENLKVKVGSSKKQTKTAPPTQPKRDRTGINNN
jgi:dsDNA-specific endonuclease/ATPase MutS2